MGTARRLATRSPPPRPLFTQPARTLRPWPRGVASLTCSVMTRLVGTGTGLPQVTATSVARNTTSVAGAAIVVPRQTGPTSTATAGPTFSVMTQLAVTGTSSPLATETSVPRGTGCLAG